MIHLFHTVWQLKKMGYLKLDGLEPAEGMLETARERNIYRNYLQIPFTANNPDVPSGMFDQPLLEPM